MLLSTAKLAGTHLWNAFEEAQQAMQPVRMPAAAVQLPGHHRHKRLLVGNGLVVSNGAAADGLLHGGLEQGGPHDHVSAPVNYHPLPMALVEAR